MVEVMVLRVLGALMVGCGGGMKLDGFFFFLFKAGLRRQLNTPGMPVITPLGVEFMREIGIFLSHIAFDSPFRRPFKALLL
jgi:hypothetical protein